MKIGDASLVAIVDEEIKIPTDEPGDRAVSVGQLRDFIGPSTEAVDSTTSVVLDFSNKKDDVFIVSSIGAAKTWSFANSGNATRFDCIFTVSGLYDQTFPSNTKMNAGAQWNTSTKIWSPIDIGTYKMTGVFNGTDWYINIDDSIFV